jgi:O-acetyl-ADP-ribose deacetylase (regulator of RNase III)
MKYNKGDLLSVTSGGIIHGCNAQGVMNSGVAKDIRQKWAVVYQDYKAAEECRGLILGTAASFTNVAKDLWVVNCITQKYYGYDRKKYASYDAIDSSVREAVRFLRDNHSISEFHVPKIGAGRGGLDWRVVETVLKVIEEEEQVTIDVWWK